MKDLIWPAVVLIIILTVWIKNPELFGKLKGNKSKLEGLSDSRIIITVGLIVFNLVSWAMIPWWWSILNDRWYTLVFFNLGFWTFLFLLTIKTKDKDSKDTKEDNPTANKMASVIVLVLILGIATTAWIDFKRDGLSEKEYDQKVVLEKAMNKAFAKEPVLAAIAKCRPPKEFDTVAKIKAASKLYEEQGLLPWHKSMSCWESMITRDMLPVRLAVVDAPIKGWGQIVNNPHMKSGVLIDWPGATSCEIMPDGNEAEKLPCSKPNFARPLKFFQFHWIGTEPSKVEVVIRQE